MLFTLPYNHLGEPFYKTYRARITSKSLDDMTFTESTIEQAAIDWLKDLGYAYVFGPMIAFDGDLPEREDYQEALLIGRLQDAIARINSELPAQAQEEALRKITRLGKPSLLLNNHAFHHMLVNGIEVDYKTNDGRTVSGRAYVVDFENEDNNDWLVSQSIYG